jgi:TonB family protein
MTLLGKYTAMFALICGLFTTELYANPTEDAAVPISVHRRIGSTTCELVQQGSLKIGKQFAWIEIEGEKGEIYSPEMGPDDYLSSLPMSGPVAKKARKSGFELKGQSTIAPDLPSVQALNGQADCPDLQNAIAGTEQARIARRSQLQSKIYSPGSDDIIPASPMKRPDPKSDQATTTNQADKGNSTKSKNKKYQGTILLAITIGTEGTIQRVRIIRSVSPELDRKATEEVSRWRFDPARKKGLPVPTEMPVEVTFNLY